MMEMVEKIFEEKSENFEKNENYGKNEKNENFGSYEKKIFQGKMRISMRK